MHEIMAMTDHALRMLIAQNRAALHGAADKARLREESDAARHELRRRGVSAHVAASAKRDYLLSD